MNSEAVKRLLQEQPFFPLEVNLSSGKSYIIHHPEFAAISKNTLVIIDPATEFVNCCSLIHVNNIVRMQPTAT